MRNKNRLYAALVLIAALAACGAAAPASAQGTVRRHGDPPAPNPTIDRDHRRGESVRATELVQWEIRSLSALTFVSLTNARRIALDMPGGLMNPVNGNRGQNASGWSPSGDRLILLRDTDRLAPGPFTPVNPAPALRPGEFFSIYDYSHGAWLDADGKWGTEPAYIWKAMQIREQVDETGRRLRFALWNSARRKFLMLCHRSPFRPANDTALCLFDETGRPG
jgi:hypothetical protein